MSAINQSVITTLVLSEDLLQGWIDAQIDARGLVMVPHLSRLWDETRQGVRQIWIAMRSDAIIGHITLQAQSVYPAFRIRQIPEIVDLWVHPAHRQIGAARALLAAVETAARDAKRTAIGLGVGVDASFGPAQRLYVSAGFVPDGTGLWHAGKTTMAFDTVTLDETALLMLVKPL